MDGTKAGSSIRTRIVRNTVVIVLVPLIVLGAVVFFSLQRLSSDAGSSVDQSRSDLSEQVVTANLEATAQNIADDLDTYLLERVQDARVWAADPLVRSAATSASAEARRLNLEGRGAEELEARFAADPTLGTSPEADAYLAAQIVASGAFAEMFFTDANGFNAAYSAKTSDFVQSDEAWWQAAWTDGLDVSPIAFDESAGTFSSDISVRIDDADGDPLGVLKAVLNLGVVQQIADGQAQNRNVTVLNEDGLILAETATEHDVERIMDAELVYAESIDPAVARSLRTAGDTGSGSVITGTSAVGAALSGRTQEPVGDFAGFGWTVVVDQPTAVAFAPIESIGDVKASIDDTTKTLTVLLLVVLLLVGAVAFLVARSLALRIVRPILRLRDAADDVATTRLPELVDSIDRLEPGQDLPALDPITMPTGDEVEELSDKFNSVIDTATRLAAEQVESRRRNVSTAFVSMGRRNQSLIGRQLKVLDDLERNERDADTLDGLFKLDQLATRMRRNAESLLVLAGQDPARTWSKPMAVNDVLRAAVGEIEDFNRIEFGDIDAAYLPGKLVSEVAHLVAELCENAAAFSPPTTKVRVSGSMRPDGYRISIIDRGIGMTEAQMAEANEKLQNPAGFDRAPSQYLGHFVVGRLAARLGVDVQLSEPPESGLVARVTLPIGLLETDAAADDAKDAAPAPAPAPAPKPPERRPVEPAPKPVITTTVGRAQPAAPERRPAPAPAPVPVATTDAADRAAGNGGGAGPAPTARPPAPAPASAPPIPAGGRGPARSAPAPTPGPTPAPAPAPRPAPSPAPSPAGEPDVEPVQVTASGFKVRQRKPATGPAPAKPAAAATPPTRSADDARNTMSSFMSGVGQGRRQINETDEDTTPETDR